MLLVQSCRGEKIFKILIFLPNIYPCVLLLIFKKRMIIKCHSQATVNFTLLPLFIIIAKKYQKVYQYLATNLFQALCIDQMFKIFSST